MKVGDLVEVKDNVSIASLRGSIGVIVRKLGQDLTYNVTGTKEEDDCFYYEVNLAARGNQVLIDRELRLVSRAERKKNENR